MQATIDDLPFASEKGIQAEESITETVPPRFQAMQIERIFRAMRPDVVFGSPVVSGAYTVITASEIAAGGGFGIGERMVPRSQPDTTNVERPSRRPGLPMFGWGGGGGATGRPVALVIIGPDGVKIEPVVDVTRIVMTVVLFWARVLPGLLRAGKGR
jgi:uncharacterized spore protein YtfJ